MAESKKDDAYYKAVIVDDEGNPIDPSGTQKAKGVAQMVAGTALVGIGVPMLILPGPGALAVVGGAAIASKGHRNLTGREALPIEHTIEQASAQLADVTKEQAKKLGEKAEKKMPEPARRIVFEDAPEVGRRVAAGGKEAARIGTELGKIGFDLAKDAIDANPQAKAAIENAPEVGRKVASGVANGALGAAKAIKGAVSKRGK